MAKRKSKRGIVEELNALDELVPEELSLPSLRDSPARVQGYAYRFFLVLPLFDAEGKQVFPNEMLNHLTHFFDKRFGGCLIASSRSGAPFFGEYLPDRTEAPVRDYHTVIIVYANPVEASDRLFVELKAILRRVPLIAQDEILIERTETYLV